MSAGKDAGGDSRVLVGKFGAAHGVRGEIRLKSYTGEPLAIAGYGPLQDSSGAKAFTLLQARHVKDDMLVVRVRGIDSRDAAQTLVNTDLYVSRAQLPPPGEEEFYLADLIGLEARLRDGTSFGRIVNVVNFGAGDILEIDSGGPATTLLPFTKAVVPEVRVPEGFVVVEPPEESEGEPQTERKFEP